jgi:hypothetical protein
MHSLLITQIILGGGGKYSSSHNLMVLHFPKLGKQLFCQGAQFNMRQDEPVAWCSQTAEVQGMGRREMTPRQRINNRWGVV